MRRATPARPPSGWRTFASTGTVPTSTSCGICEVVQPRPWGARSPGMALPVSDGIADCAPTVAPELLLGLGIRAVRDGDLAVPRPQARGIAGGAEGASL